MMKGNKELREKKKREITPEKISAMAEFVQNAEQEYIILNEAREMEEELEKVKSIIKEVSKTKKLDGFVNRMSQAIGVMVDILDKLRTKTNQKNIKKPKGRPQKDAATQMSKQTSNQYEPGNN